MIAERCSRSGHPGPRVRVVEILGAWFLRYAVQPDNIHFARLTNHGSRLHCAGNCLPNHSFPGTSALGETMN